MNVTMNGSPAARLLGGCRSASIWRSDKPQDSLVSDLQDLNPQSTREKRFADEDTRPISSLSQDTASGTSAAAQAYSLTNGSMECTLANHHTALCVFTRRGPQNGPARG
jgi:hypothetical protein